MASPPKIPDRSTSLKRIVRTPVPQDTIFKVLRIKERRILEIDELLEEIKESKKRRRGRSSHQGFVSDLHDTFTKRARVASLRIQKSCEAFNGTHEEWLLSAEVPELLKQEDAAQWQLKKWTWHTEQLEKLKLHHMDLHTEFRNRFKTSSLGWGLSLGRGKQPSDHQERFREAILKVYGVKNEYGAVCCPITQHWYT